MVEIKPYYPEVVSQLADHIKEMDLLELRAVSDDPVEVAIHKAVTNSDLVLVIMNAGVALGLFGYKAKSGGARVWMISTAEVSACGKSLTKSAKAILDEWSARFGLLWNYVYSGNTTTVDWLTFLGFTIHSTVPTYGAHSEPYHCMVRERK